MNKKITSILLYHKKPLYWRLPNIFYLVMERLFLVKFLFRLMPRMEILVPIKKDPCVIPSNAMIAYPMAKDGPALFSPRLSVEPNKYEIEKAFGL